MSQSHYPHFDVMTQVEEWDPFTQSVVQRRLECDSNPRFLSAHEAKTLRAVIAHLLYEDRDEPIGFVIAHIDRRLHSGIGESQREKGIPAEHDLLRRGLAALDAVANRRHGKVFVDCNTEQQFHMVAQLQKGEWETQALPEHTLLPQKALFKKLLALAVEAYASYPMVWSEMGYAGPAYPRGYYRIEQGVTDPWEPRRDQ